MSRSKDHETSRGQLREKITRRRQHRNRSQMDRPEIGRQEREPRHSPNQQPKPTYCTTHDSRRKSHFSLSLVWQPIYGTRSSEQKPKSCLLKFTEFKNLRLYKVHRRTSWHSPTARAFENEAVLYRRCYQEEFVLLCC